MDRLYGKESLLNDLKTIGNKLPKKIRVYLIGGWALSLKNIKLATKDVDVIFTSKNDLELFEEKLVELGYVKELKVESTYRQLGAYSILRNPEKAGFDLFHKQVCNMLKISEGMIKRSSKYVNFHNLELFLISNEDITLFKGITQRPRDIDDIAAIIKSVVAEGKKFNWDAIKSEIVTQDEELKIEWHLYDRFSELFAKYQLRSPLLSWLRKRGIKKLLHESYLSRLEKEMNHEEIIAEFEKGGFTKTDIKILKSFKKK